MKKASKEDYVLCGPCSAEAGREVHVDRALLRTENSGPPDFEDTQVCPKGHRIEASGGN